MTNQPTESPAEIAERLLPCTQEDSIDASGNYVGHDGYCPAYYRADVATALRAERERALEEVAYLIEGKRNEIFGARSLSREIRALAQKGGNK